MGAFLEEVYEDCFILGEDRGVRLFFQAKRNLVMGDKEKLKEVLFNLISNALKHTNLAG